MALDLPHSQFFHVQKTGGTWVRRAIANAGIPGNELGGIDFFGAQHIGSLKGHFYHASPDRVHGHGKFRFAFVRNPLTWYQSMYAFLESGGWRHRQFPPADSFADFMEAMLRDRPGYLSRTYRRYAGVNYLGRYESLADDLVTALRLAGEEFDEATLRATPPVNVAGQLPDWRERCLYTDDLRQRVVEAEAEAFDLYRFDPHAAPAQRDVRVVYGAA